MTHAVADQVGGEVQPIVARRIVAKDVALHRLRTARVQLNQQSLIVAAIGSRIPERSRIIVSSEGTLIA